MTAFEKVVVISGIVSAVTAFLSGLALELLPERGKDAAFFTFIAAFGVLVAVGLICAGQVCWMIATGAP